MPGRTPKAGLASGVGVVSPTPRPHSASGSARPPQPAVLEIPMALPEAAPAVPGWVEATRKLADAGHLSRAMEICEQHFAKGAPTAEGLYLKGLLHDALGQFQQASEHYRKAVYLDPVHHEALVHLAMAFSRDGDVSGAERLFERAKRARGGR